MSRVRLDGAVTLVTGAGSGIGAATARRFARSGSRVLLVDVDEGRAQDVAEECSSVGPPAEAHACDVADAAEVSALAERVAAEHGALDVLVNNAGVGVAGRFLDTTLEDWQWLRSINLDGVAHGCLAFGPAMVERARGHVVNVASGAAYVPNRNMAAYCASKAAVMMLSQCLRADWGPAGVGVSVICPGVIRTPIPANTRYRGAMAAKQQAAVRAFRFGHPPEAVAKAIVGAVERNRDVVPVGLESSLALRLLRGAPQPIQNLVARAEIL